MKRSSTVFLSVSLGFLLTLAGCAAPGAIGSASSVGIDGQVCEGRVPDALPGLVPSDNPALLRQAQLASGKGGTCTARVFAVQEPVVLYRVFDSTVPYSRFGGWWSANPPTGTPDSYRQAFAICPAWSRLDRVISCQIHPGTQVVVGTTQSVACGDGQVFPKTAEIQVFVPNNGEKGIFHTGACSPPAVWP